MKTLLYGVLAAGMLVHLPLASAGVTLLTDPDKIKEHKESPSSSSSSNSSKKSSSDSSSYNSNYNHFDDDDDEDDDESLADQAVGAVIGGIAAGAAILGGEGESFHPYIPRGHAILEYGRYNWDVSSSSGYGSETGPNFIGEYDIDPVDTIKVGGLFRRKNLSGGLSVLTDPTGEDRAQMIYGGAMYMDPGLNHWWSLSAEYGRVEGEATTTDYQGNRYTALVDTDWNRVLLEWCHISGGSIGLAYEVMDMPAVISLDDYSGAVFAFFDDSTSWSTISLQGSYDTAMRRMIFRNEGLGFDFGVSAAFGVGWMSADYDGIDEIVAQYGYSYNENKMITSFGIDGRIGGSYTKVVKGNTLQLYMGVSGRYTTMNNIHHDYDNPYETLDLDAVLDIGTYGFFTRFTIHW